MDGGVGQAQVLEPLRVEAKRVFVEPHGYIHRGVLTNISGRRTGIRGGYFFCYPTLTNSIFCLPDTPVRHPLIFVKAPSVTVPQDRLINLARIRTNTLPIPTAPVAGNPTPLSPTATCILRFTTIPVPSTSNSIRLGTHPQTRFMTS